MSSATPEIKPQFGALYFNPSAGKANPHRIGRFVKAFRRTGRVNPGLTWEMTDGKGDFWEIKPEYLVPATPEPELNVEAVCPCGFGKLHFDGCIFQCDWTHKICLEKIAESVRDDVGIQALIQQVSDQRVQEALK